MAIETQYGQSEFYFGGKDYEAARAQGKSPSEVLSYLIANPDRLRMQNVPGGGGLYDQIMLDTQAQYSQEARQQQDAARQAAQDQQRAFEERIAQQQSMFQSQLMEQQKQAQEAQRQLMIQMQRPDRAPAEVRMAGGDQKQLGRRGTTGYFGREGMRISGLNVPTSGLAISPNTTMRSGSFA